jgi:hypothetical protein
VKYVDLPRGERTGHARFYTADAAAAMVASASAGGIELGGKPLAAVRVLSSEELESYWCKVSAEARAARERHAASDRGGRGGGRGGSGGARGGGARGGGRAPGGRGRGGRGGRAGGDGGGKRPREEGGDEGAAKEAKTDAATAAPVAAA